MAVDASPTEAMSLTGSMPTLERMPSELLWMIIDFLFDSHSVFDLRLASKTLLSRVSEYARRGMIIPVIDKVIFSGVFIGSINEPVLKIDILVARRNSSRFERRLALLQPQFNLSSRLERYNIFDAEKIHYEFKFDVEEDDWAVLGYLRDCMGRRICVAKLADCDEREKMTAVSIVLGGVKIDLLHVVVDLVSDHVADHLLNIITLNNVDRLSLWATRIDSSRPVRVLVNLATVVQAIHIFQRNDMELKAGERSYLLGLRNVDWAIIFREMFSKKLDKLYIGYGFFGRYLEKEVADDLIATLPQLGKKIWFESICLCYNKGFNFETNDHSVGVKKSARRFSSGKLAIKHCSRVKEQFELPKL